MFEKTISTLQSFYDAYNKALAEYETDVAKLNNVYVQGSPFHKETLDSIKQRYNRKIAAAFSESNAIIQKDLAASREQVKQIIATSIIPSIYDTISLINNHVVADDEIDTVLEPYVNNYMSYKVLLKELATDPLGTDLVWKSISHDGVLPYSEVLNHIDIIQRWTDNFLLLAMSDLGMQSVLQGDLIPNHAITVNKFILRFTKGAKYVKNYCFGYDMENPDSWYFIIHPQV